MTTQWQNYKDAFYKGVFFLMNRSMVLISKIKHSDIKYLISMI